ncbi:type IV pilus assembly protein PilM [Serpentinicella alkaliphila]|uniref:Type IV pilus assembly protein PilM n=1 Tax=Serpentinicella alkaliphila TaxID=1734049 RepID=A0A4R2THC9_9FIRM|nr:type IV pilus assembly protein PilM [Serpentinicella alkaliphila]QUH26667.1 type IV pilus assembly protein PilM [Serpentinicella alkaliphila]TCQ00535.1 type IV pilus assembly protein PilM [Serpentinicella alkaliphila]
MGKSIFSIWNKDILSIDIGSHSIKMAVGKYEKNLVTITKVVNIDTSDDSLFDDRTFSMLRLKETIAKALHNHRINTTKTICSIESSSIITREIYMPSVKPEQLKGMLEFEIEQYLPIQVNEYIIQYKILETFEDGGMEKTKVLATALPNKIAEDYFHLIESLGLQPIVLDIHSNGVDKIFSLCERVNKQDSMSNKTIAVIDIGHTQINTIIIEKGIFKFNRLLKMGGKDIDTNICTFLDFSLGQAEKMKKQILDINEGLHNFTAASSTDIAEATDMGYIEKELEDFSYASRFMNVVKSSIDNWVTEIEKVFKYYTTRNTGNMIDEIYIYGGSSELGGIDKYLEGAFNIPTYKIDYLSNLNTDKAGTISLASYINNIGALIRRSGE